MSGITHKSNFGIKHTITASEASAGTVTLTLNSSYDLVYTVMCLNSTGTVIDMTGAIIVESSSGVLTISSGGWYTVTSTDVLFVTAHVDSSNYS